MNATNCTLCHSAPVAARWAMRGLLDGLEVVQLYVCHACCDDLRKGEWLGLAERMIDCRRARVGKRVLPATDEVVAGVLKSCLDLRDRLTGEYVLLD